MLTAMTALGDLAERAASTDPRDGLEAVAALRRILEDLEDLHVQYARRTGWSWQDIANALGVTKQTVHRKHHRLESARHPA